MVEGLLGSMRLSSLCCLRVLVLVRSTSASFGLHSFGKVRSKLMASLHHPKLVSANESAFFGSRAIAEKFHVGSTIHPHLAPVG